jgi:signal transduction histidine kinase
MTSWLSLLRRTVRLRLTLAYAGLFIVSGTALLGITFVLATQVTSHGTSGVSASVPGSAAPPDVASGPAGQIGQVPPGTETGISFPAALAAAEIGLVVMAMASIASGWVVAGRVLRPLRTMTATTRQISEHNLHERLAMRGPDDELKDLADTIDGLLGRLEASFSAQRRFVANASHELRTPLAMIRTSVDVATAKPEPVPAQVHVLAGKVREGLDRADRLLAGLLILARVQHGAVPDRTTVSLPAVVSGALAERARAIASMDIAVDRMLRDAPVCGSEALLSRMVDNLVDNAVRHNERGGWVRVETGTNDSVAWLVVETGGRVLDDREVQELAQPFRRLGGDRTGSENGTGLGLSIVAAIAEAHGGALHLRARAEGGLWVEVVLPA